jgi:type VI protein secretion system component VasK
MMQFFGLTLGILAVWRITHLLVAEDGPWDLLARLRQRVAASFWSSLFGCFYCLSLWVSVPFALLLAQGWKERLLMWPALSAGAILLERLTSRDGAAPAAYVEEEESADVRLRQEESIPASEPSERRTKLAN